MKIVFKWLFASVFAMSALFAFALQQFGAAFFYTLGAAICAPPLLAWIEQKTNIHLQSWQKYVAVITAFVLGALLMNPQYPKRPKPAESAPTTQTASTQAAPPPLADTVSQADALRQELDFIANEFDETKFWGSIEAAQGELALFYLWNKQIELGQKNADPEAQKLAEQLKHKVTKMQVSDFPKLRKIYAQSLHGKTWEHDVTVSVSGKGNTILQLTSYHFAANRNIKDMQEILGATPSEFRFKQVQYRSYNGADEYQYFKINAPGDGELVELSL